MVTIQKDEGYSKALLRNRSLRTGAFVFATITGYFVLTEGSITIWQLAIALVVGVFPVLFRWRLPLPDHEVDELEWSLSLEPSELKFHWRNNESMIRGEEITRIRAGMHSESISWLDIHHNDQVTRIEHYERMNEVLAHTLRIAGNHVVLEEIR